MEEKDVWKYLFIGLLIAVAYKFYSDDQKRKSDPTIAIPGK